MVQPLIAARTLEQAQTLQLRLMPDIAQLVSAASVDNSDGGTVPGSTPGTTFPCRLTANRDRQQEALIDGQIQGRPTYWLSYPLVYPDTTTPIVLPGSGQVQVNAALYHIAAVLDPGALSTARRALLWRTQTP